MAAALLAIALLQLTPQQEADQRSAGNALDQWVKGHQVELRQEMDRINRVRALSYDQALIVYDQCLAHAAASLDDVAPDALFGRALATCMPLRAELLDGRPGSWFVGFRDLDAAKRASFPALARKIRARLRNPSSESDTTGSHD